ncbi:uncharacterized protein LOC143445442 [Clavelina lepadiformis]|uniref:uncharacterized protein LOC143445442 n=1 Tax=Clavelina lepadiformis TaxID=159417 RepID=UPI004041080F
MPLFETPTKDQLIENPGKLINTLVFLTLNASSINAGSITEISLIAIHKNELLTNQHNCENSKMESMLRIVDKLTLFVDAKMSVDQHIASLTNLNESVVIQAKKAEFNSNVVQLVHGFLKRQEAPVCLVAHNGFRLAYQVLQMELQRTGHTLNVINNQDLLCADSLWTFKMIDNKAAVKKYGVSILDMVYYTQASLCTRYLTRNIPHSFTAEEANIQLMELVYYNKIPFLDNLCCKKFSLIKPASLGSMGFPIKMDSELSSKTETFVFFDLETTDLLKRKVTEICMIAVNREALESAEEIPRVYDKLSLIVDPIINISEGACRISGLTNHLISRSAKEAFNPDTTFTIMNFLQRQAPPICLLAHNGVEFDFPILRDHLTSFDIKFPFFNELYCSDTVIGMRSLWNAQNSTQYAADRKYVSFKLQSVYERYFPDGEAPKYHHAEGDVLALIKISMKFPGLLSWLDQEKKKFF